MVHMNMRLLVLAGLLFTAKVVIAQGPNVTCADGSSPTGRLSVTGQGSVKSLPDSATIVLRVEVTRANATDARETGALAVNATLAALAKAGVQTDAISTSGLTLQPGYEYEPATGAQKPTGITFAQTLEVKLTNVTTQSIGTVVDTAVAGSSDVQVSSVTTSLSPSAMKNTTNSARQLAVSDALNTAQVLSTAAGVALGPITLIADNNSTPPVPYGETAPSADAAGPPEKGTPTTYVVGPYETVASVSMEVAICRVVA